MKTQKFVSLKKLSTILKTKLKDKKIVFTNGCFDILHVGHVHYLTQAKAKGDVLIIGLNSDQSVKKLKGKNRPLNCEQDRAKVLAALTCVDFIVVFNDSTPYRLIQTIKPNVLIKGGDWSKDKIVGRDIVLACGGKVLTIPIVKNRSTSNIIKKIFKTC
jgi:D-beta-D-heptose 7-phosphate kinase/D-beta-D-heptose 1-phosphate adenosyltransferase